MLDIFTTKHLTFQRLPLKKGRLTSVWSVWNHTYGENLGQLRWYAPWRQYCFMGENLVFSQGCLTDIANMLARLSEERRSKERGDES